MRILLRTTCRCDMSTGWQDLIARQKTGNIFEIYLQIFKVFKIGNSFRVLQVSIEINKI